jgi:hypothetical protein
MAWYLEIYDRDGGLLSSENGATYDAVLDAAKACRSGDFGSVRFIGPVDATPAQLQALEELGAERSS